jgi:pimeloyl-ACP methyl ester carboxylesterase
MMSSRIRTLLLISIGLLGHFFLSAQPFAVGHLATTYTDAGRSNRSVPVEIYYPADIAGDGVPVAADSGARYPVLVFRHGFVMSWDAYANIWNALVPAGYIIAFPRTETGLSPQHAELGRDLSFVRNALLSEGADPGSLFYQRIAPVSAVMGHSMGGGASFLAAAQDTGFTAMVNFAAAETSPSAIAAASLIGGSLAPVRRGERLCHPGRLQPTADVRFARFRLQDAAGHPRRQSLPNG